MKDKITYYKWAGIAILLLLWLPIGQEAFHFFKVKELKGTYDKYDQPYLTPQSWLRESFQDSMENYLQLHFGFSADLTRLHNQMVFSFFKSTRSPSVVIGKKNEIFDFGHIQAHLGNDYIGLQAIEMKVKALEEINNILLRFNTHLVIVIAPSKPSYCPEFLPDEFVKQNKPTNYDIYRQLLPKKNIPFLNLSQVYKNWKPTAKYPLFPQCGVHWSEYGATLAADSTLHFLENHLQANLTEINIDSVRVSQQLSDSDYDMGNILNLLYPIRPYPMAYPYLSFTENETDKKISLLSVADSYYWIWYNEVGFNSRIFKQSIFYEYFQSVHTSTGPERKIGQVDVVNEVVNSDVVLIMASECNLYRLGYGFIEEMYKLLPIFNKLYQSKLEFYKIGIQQDAAWYEQIQNKARDKNISVDSMLTLDAMYLLEHNPK
jgi:hypothetical protein